MADVTASTPVGRVSIPSSALISVDFPRLNCPRKRHSSARWQAAPPALGPPLAMAPAPALTASRSSTASRHSSARHPRVALRRDGPVVPSSWWAGIMWTSAANRDCDRGLRQGAYAI